MSHVDPDDDSIRRFIVQHYRYDPDRHERRVVVAAFDNEHEFDTCLRAHEAELRAGRDRGDSVVPREYVSGVVHEAGYRRRQQNDRILTRAIRRGALPPNWSGLELRSSVAVVSPGSRPVE